MCKATVQISRAMVIIINLHKNESSQQDTDDHRATNEAQKLVSFVFHLQNRGAYFISKTATGKMPKISPQIWISLRESNSPLDV